MDSKALEAARSLVAALEEEAKPFTLPDPGISLSEALRRLYCIVGTSCSVGLDLWAYERNGTDSYKTNFMWKVWDGVKHFEGKTLEAAISQCEQSHLALPDNDAIAAAQAKIDGAVKIPF